MMMKKHALLIALASALALGAVTTSFAQEAGRYGYTGGYSSQYGNSYNAPRENDSGYAGPSGE
jgi:ABC-type sugar transport system substrate-binding protein